MEFGKIATFVEEHLQLRRQGWTKEMTAALGRSEVKRIEKGTKKGADAREDDRPLRGLGRPLRSGDEKKRADA